MIQAEEQKKSVTRSNPENSVNWFGVSGRRMCASPEKSVGWLGVSRRMFEEVMFEACGHRML